jgi:hypothetical protein
MLVGQSSDNSIEVKVTARGKPSDSTLSEKQSYIHIPPGVFFMNRKVMDVPNI